MSELARYDLCAIHGGGHGIFPKEDGRYYKAEDVDEYIASLKHGVITIKEEDDKLREGWYLFKWKSVSGNESSDFACYYFDGEDWYANNNCHEDHRMSHRSIDANFQMVTKIGMEL